MSHHEIFLMIAGSATVFAAVSGVAALIILVRSGREEARAASRQRTSLWIRVLISLIVILAVLPAAITSDWRWQLCGILGGLILWFFVVLLLAKIRSTKR
jgi:cytochrome bd-type quinol oxidase subunit 2